MVQRMKFLVFTSHCSICSCCVSAPSPANLQTQAEEGGYSVVICDLLIKYWTLLSPLYSSFWPFAYSYKESGLRLHSFWFLSFSKSYYTTVWNGCNFSYNMKMLWKCFFFNFVFINFAIVETKVTPSKKLISLLGLWQSWRWRHTPDMMTFQMRPAGIWCWLAMTFGAIWSPHSYPLSFNSCPH